MLNLKQFVNPVQLSVMRSLCRGEEGAHFVDTIKGLQSTIANMPVTYETDGQGDNAIAHLHYFSGASDWWITERDIGDPEDAVPGEQHQAFGFSCLNGWTDCAELGYISISELIHCGVELDLNWSPVSIGEIKRGLQCH